MVPSLTSRTGELLRTHWSEAKPISPKHKRSATPLKAVLDRVHPDDRALVERMVDRARTHRQAFDFEHRLQMQDGSVKHLHVVSRVLADEPQNLRFAGAIMDITERKQTEEALRRSEQRYQNLFQAMAVAFFELDFTGVGDLLRDLRAACTTGTTCATSWL
jgi:PAS domain-containing protein